MQNDDPFQIDEKVIFSRCDICDKPYEAYEREISNPTSAVSEEELQQQEPLLVLCDSCRQELTVFPLLRYS